MNWGLLFKKKGKTKVNKRIYLDNAAATPVRSEVLETMKPYFSDSFGNPSAVHYEGVVARKSVEDARTKIARTLSVRPSGVIFTGNGTESNNLAIYGVIRELNESGIQSADIEIVTTGIEHPSVSRVLEHLKTQGVVVKICRVDEFGLIDIKNLEKLLSVKTALITFGYANSEVGVVQEVKRITRIIKSFNSENGTEILTHLDAAQAPLWLPCQLDMLGVDLLSLDAGKCYGPKGVGILAMQHGVKIKGIVLGGDQEFGLRAGTENTALIVGAAAAVVWAQDDWKSRSEAVASLRDFLIEELKSAIPQVVINGPYCLSCHSDNEKENRIANNVNISIPGLDTEYAVIVLDAKGVAASTKSACSGASGEGSEVVRAISGDTARATSTIRFSLGVETRKKDLMRAVEVLKEHVEKTL